MSKQLAIAFFLMPFTINFILLFWRKKAWIDNIYKWYTVIILALIGLLFLLFFPDNSDNNLNVFWSFCTPATFSAIDFLFKKISISLNDRDLKLWLKGSGEENLACNLSDKILSIILLYVWIFLPFLSVFFHK